MDELIQKKMEIAKRAGELEAEISGLIITKIQIKKNIETKNPLYVNIRGFYMSNSGQELDSNKIDPNGYELHGVLLVFINAQIDKRTAELNELIKVLV